MRRYARFSPSVKRVLKNGGVGVIPTDTMYGIVGSALSRVAVKRLYRLRKRDLKKPMIVLIGSIDDLKKFGVELSGEQQRFLRRVWPGPVSVILPTRSQKFHYLHRGTNTIAFRLPKYPALRRLLGNVGPLVAPSANIEGKQPARTFLQARRYFGSEVDFYVDRGMLSGVPSKLVELGGVELRVLRRGAAPTAV